MTEDKHSLDISASTPQRPIGSGFNAASTASDVIKGINLKGKIAIVSGGYSGLGLETTRILQSAGAKVIVPVRDMNKAKRAIAKMHDIEIHPLDLTNPASIDKFTSDFLNSGRPLHILVNCAGIMASPLMRDSRGYEAQFSTNHLGHFHLTMRLFPALRKAKGARVVAVSSRGHRYSPVVFEDINFKYRDYTPFSAYGQSKTANILFALALDRLGKPDNVRAFSVHPGSIVNTDLTRYSPSENLRKMGFIDDDGNPVIDPLRQLKTVEQGASTIVWCATNSKLEGKGGVYCENNDITSVVTDTDPNDPLIGADSKGNYGMMPYATDMNAASLLWKVSEQLIYGGL
jgi:NAD(P)-dependent dehydrogenase (short-subunit alcohol dehydrogenase family)